MAQKRMGGAGARLKPALDYANEKGWSISFTKKQHVVFTKGDGRVTASGTPRSPDNLKRVLGQLKKADMAMAKGLQPPQD